MSFTTAHKSTAGWVLLVQTITSKTLLSRPETGRGYQNKKKKKFFLVWRVCNNIMLIFYIECGDNLIGKYMATFIPWLLSCREYNIFKVDDKRWWYK